VALQDPRRRHVLTTLALAPLGLARAQEKAQVIYAWPESMLDDARSELPILLLEQALMASGGGYRPRPAPRDLTQSRSLRHLRLDRGLDVAWTFTSSKRETALLPIRIPLDRGLLG
jgi:hypothetical protein